MLLRMAGMLTMSFVAVVPTHPRHRCLGARVLPAVREPEGGILQGDLGCGQLEGRGEEAEVDGGIARRRTKEDYLVERTRTDG